jgi:hypothetical protein
MNLLERFEKLSPGHIMTVAGAGYQDGIPAKEADAGRLVRIKGVGR